MMNLSASQRHCLKVLDIPVWESSIKAHHQTNSELFGNKTDPSLCLVLNSEKPEKMLSGQQLLEDVLSFLGHSAESIAWCHASDDMHFLANVRCPVWPQNEKTAHELAKAGIVHLPSMAKLLNQCATKADLLIALSSAKK